MFDIETKAEKKITNDSMVKDIKIVKFVPGTKNAIIANENKLQAWSFLDQSKIYQTDEFDGISSIELMPQLPEFCVVGSTNKYWSVFNVVEGTQVCKVPTDSSVTDVGFQPDGLILATGHDSGEIKLWDIRTLEVF